MKYLCLICTFIIFPGCQTSMPKKDLNPSDLILAANQTLTSPEILSAEQVKEEVALTLYALRKGYGGRNHLPAKIFSDALKKIESIEGSQTPTQLKDRIDAILHSIPDNHLKARLVGEPSPERKGAIKKINVGENAISNPKKIWEVRVDSFKKKRILFISITSFPSYKDPIWKGFLEEVGKHLKVTSAAVLDFRSNGGGDDTMGYSLAKLLYGGDYNHPLNTAYLSQTPETFILGANNFRLHQIRMRSEGENPPAYFDELFGEYFEKYEKALAGKLEPEAIVTEKFQDYKFNAEKGFNKPIYILLNGQCASSCESSTDAFEPHPLVKRVGTPTAGMIHFGNVGALLLPYSKIHIQIPTKTNEYFDKRFIEKTGIKPDYLLQEGQDAYQYVKEKLIETAK